MEDNRGEVVDVARVTPAFLGFAAAVLIGLSIYVEPDVAALRHQAEAAHTPWPVGVQVTLDRVGPFAADSNLRLVAAALLLLMALYSLRRALLARAARSLRSVELAPVVLAPNQMGPEVAGALRARSVLAPGRPALLEKSAPLHSEIVAQFRSTLSAITFTVPSSVPLIEGEQESVVKKIGTASESKTQLGVVLGALAALAWPAAYRVALAPRVKDIGTKCRLTVTVTSTTPKRSRTFTVDGDTWASATDRAAEFVAAFLVPRTSLSSRPPWLHWKRYNLPPELVYYYRAARSAVQDKDFPGALSAYRSFLTIDPYNPHIRIEVAQLYEQMGAFFHAMSIYADITAIEEKPRPTAFVKNRRLREDFMLGVPAGASPRSAYALQISKYRLACRLVSIDRETVQSWEDLPDETRNILNGILSETQETIRRWARPSSGVLHTLCDEQELDTDQRLLVFRLAGLIRARGLVRAYSWYKVRRGERPPASMHILRLLRLGATLYAWDAIIRIGVKDGAAINAFLRPTILARIRDNGSIHVESYPINRRELTRKMRHIYRIPRRLPSRWQEYYTAACVYAVALFAWGDHRVQVRDPKRPRIMRLLNDQPDEIEDAAIFYLTVASRLLHSGEAAQEFDWIESKDPDLAALRGRPRFQAYLNLYFARRWPDSINDPAGP